MPPRERLLIISPPVSRSVSSLLTFHDESLNVWTHALACVWFGRRLVALPSLPTPAPLLPERLSVGLFLFCATFCLGMSALAHLAGPHLTSRRSFELIWQLDSFGIVGAIIGSFVSGLVCGMRCVPTLRLGYLIFVGALLGGVTLIVAAGDRVADLTRFRALAASVVFGLVPFFHWLSIAPADLLAALAPGVWRTFLLYGAGYAYFSSLTPAPITPARALGGSHVAWHVLVVAGLREWAEVCRQMLAQEAVGCDAWR